MTELIAYYRVSTKQQGESGLGLEAQRKAVEDYAKSSGAKIKADFVEVESGKLSSRPELARALAHAKRSKATLCVAKLDRLSRNVAFLSALMESKVAFVAVDNPHATKFTIHILAAVAEHEAEMISKRTKDALAAAKVRGQLLGSARPGHWEGREEVRRQGGMKGLAASIKVRQENARQAYADLLPELQQLRAEGLSLAKIADKLNTDGHTTRRGRPWNPMQVKLVLDRASGE